MAGFDLRSYNRRAWDALVARGNQWTRPVDAETIARARAGDFSVVLTPTEPVPRSWLGDLAGADVLGLASAGGQQGPILAAAGARVTVFDNSPAQLDRDRQVAAREGLELECVEGDMRDLGAFADASFDLIFHPCSNCFVDDVNRVWREAHRVLRPGGALLAGVCNPLMYLFDDARMQAGELEVRHSLPYSDLTSLSDDEREALYQADEPISFGHTLTDQIGGQLAAGLVIVGFYEDGWGGEATLDRFTPTFIATRARRPPLDAS